MLYPDWCILHCKGYQETRRCFIDDCTKPQTRKHTPDEPIFEPYTDIEGNTHIDARYIDNKVKVIKNLKYHVTNPETYSQDEIESIQSKHPKLIIHHTNIIK